MKINRILYYGLISLLASVMLSSALKAGPAENIAKAYGIENFSKIKQISYTFNVRVNGNEIHRRWRWFPKTDQVESVDLVIKYPRDFIPEELKSTDHSFINDNYWLLFPFHLVWDSDVKFEEVKGKRPSPIKKEMLNKLIVKYINDKGYTPNDIYELYFDDKYIIREWVYRKGGSVKNARAATWENNKKYRGIIISENHTGGDNFRLWFSDIEVE